MKIVHAFISKLVLAGYRTFALVGLISVLLGVVGYTMMLGFYGFNNTWVVPTIIHPEDGATLELNERMLNMEQTIRSLRLDTTQTRLATIEMRQHLSTLLNFEPAFKKAAYREQQHNQVNGQELEVLDRQKQADNDRSTSVLSQVKEIEDKIDQELTAGLITKGEAAIQKSQLNQLYNSTTDGKIDEVLMRDQLLQKNTIGTISLDIWDKRVELVSKIATLQYEIIVAEEREKTNLVQIQQLTTAIEVAKKNPYYVSVSSGNLSNFAFVPYDNKNVDTGSLVYDCYLNLIVCRSVGTIKRVFPSEVKLQNPIFHTDLRGYMIELSLTDVRSATSKTLFLGHKPLLF